jgi:hypothetical protein
LKKKWKKKPHNKHRGSFFARFLVIVAWITFFFKAKLDQVTEFGLPFLQQHGVVDVAGGHGDLAFQLQCLRNVPCVVI